MKTDPQDGMERNNKLDDFWPKNIYKNFWLSTCTLQRGFFETVKINDINDDASWK